MGPCRAGAVAQRLVCLLNTQSGKSDPSVLHRQRSSEAGIPSTLRPENQKLEVIFVYVVSSKSARAT